MKNVVLLVQPRVFATLHSTSLWHNRCDQPVVHHAFPRYSFSFVENFAFSALSVITNQVLQLVICGYDVIKKNIYIYVYMYIYLYIHLLTMNDHIY